MAVHKTSAVSHSDWVQDVLGEPYESSTFTFPDDAEGEVVATLVRRRAAQPTRRAVLYVHGFIDYFFQTHLTDYFVEAGYDFYALDLRKYGRSLRPHQTPNLTYSLAEYAPEIDAAVALIRDTDEHDVLLLNGHSTGGLITALWAHHHAGEGRVGGLFLNSPFLDINESWLVREIVSRGIVAATSRMPDRIVPSSLSEHYVHSIHSDWRGTWTFDLRWKPAEGFPVRAGWLGAIRRGHRAVAHGLSIDVPVLVMSSTRSVRPKAWDDVLHSADAVLDAERIARLAPRLGRHVTVVRIDGGMHDLVLSGDAARAQVFAELGRWTKAYLPE